MALEVRKLEDLITVKDCDLPGVFDGDDEACYTVRTLTTAKIQEIRAPYDMKKFNKRTHKTEPVEWTAEQELDYSADLIDYALKDWSGVLYNGQPLPCERDTKLLLDGSRRTAILAVAGLNKVGAKPEAAQPESFRATEDVLPVHAG
jgi:hypothetical protein